MRVATDSFGKCAPPARACSSFRKKANKNVAAALGALSMCIRAFGRKRGLGAMGVAVVVFHFVTALLPALSYHRHFHHHPALCFLCSLPSLVSLVLFFPSFPSRIASISFLPACITVLHSFLDYLSDVFPSSLRFLPWCASLLRFLDMLT